MKAWLSARFSANQLHPRVCFCGVVLTTGISKVAAQTGSFAPVGFGNSNHRKFHPRMAQVQHDPELSSARQSHLENTTANRPSAAQSEKTEEELKRYTCLYFGYASNFSPVTLKQRCPDSLFISLATLPGYRWIINETGYANIIPSSDPDKRNIRSKLGAYRNTMIQMSGRLEVGRK